MSTLIVVQARMASTRLPGKVCMPLAGQPLLLRQIERIAASRCVASGSAAIVVATTTSREDARLTAMCRNAGIDCHVGHPTDLLQRHRDAAMERGAEVVVKIPSDCPLIDPDVVDVVLERYRVGDCDFASNLHPPSYPDGNDVEVVSTALLDLACREAERPHEREHTTPFFWDRPTRFRIGNVAARGEDLSMSHQFTVDYLDDYRFVSAVYDELYRHGAVFKLRSILALLAGRPDIRRMNAHYVGVNWYRHHLDELRTVDARATRTVGGEVMRRTR